MQKDTDLFSTALRHWSLRGVIAFLCFILLCLLTGLLFDYLNGTGKWTKPSILKDSANYAVLLLGIGYYLLENNTKSLFLTKTYFITFYTLILICGCIRFYAFFQYSNPTLMTIYHKDINAAKQVKKTAEAIHNYRSIHGAMPNNLRTLNMRGFIQTPDMPITLKEIKDRSFKICATYKHSAKEGRRAQDNWERFYYTAGTYCQSFDITPHTNILRALDTKTGLFHDL